MAAVNEASTSSTLLSPGGFALKCLPTAVATFCRSWGVSHQAPTVHWWFIWDPQPAVSSKMAKELDGCGHNVVVRNGKEGGLRVHRNVQYEFAIPLPH